MPSLVHRDTGRVLAERVTVCRTFWAQLRGAIGREPGNGDAFALPHCRQIHTAFLHSSLDVVFCDGAGQVLWRAILPPWRISPVIPHAAIVYEAIAGTFEGLTISGEEVISNTVLVLLEPKSRNDA